MRDAQRPPPRHNPLYDGLIRKVLTTIHAYCESRTDKTQRDTNKEIIPMMIKKSAKVIVIADVNEIGCPCVDCIFSFASL